MGKRLGDVWDHAIFNQELVRICFIWLLLFPIIARKLVSLGACGDCIYCKVAAVLLLYVEIVASRIHLILNTWLNFWLFYESFLLFCLGVVWVKQTFDLLSLISHKRFYYFSILTTWIMELICLLDKEIPTARALIKREWLILYAASTFQAMWELDILTVCHVWKSAYLLLAAHFVEIIGIVRC